MVDVVMASVLCVCTGELTVGGLGSASIVTRWSVDYICSVQHRAHRHMAVFRSM